MNTAIMTRVIETMAPPSSRMASREAVRAEVYPKSSLACTPSTTTMASSTTMAMARTRAERVRRLREKPMRLSTKKVPTKATGMAMVGMSVERRSCRKINTTKKTSTKASMRVFTTSWIDAKRKSFTFCAIWISNPAGIEDLLSSRVFSMS